jgi:hypothetical protein
MTAPRPMAHSSTASPWAGLVIWPPGASEKSRFSPPPAQAACLSPILPIFGMPCEPSKTTVKSTRLSSGENTPPASAGCTSATASRACGYGSNFRLTEMQSAIGRILLQRLPKYTATRTRNALLPSKALADCSAVCVPLSPEWITHAWYKFYVFVKPDVLGECCSGDRFLSEMQPLVIPPSPAVAAKSTSSVAFRMQVSPPPNACPWPASWVRPA